MRVGFIGLGDQGGPMARRIVEDGYPLTIWGRREATVAAFAGTGAVVAGSPVEVGAASDLVGVCVVDDAGVEEVVPAVLAGMRPGGVVAVHSTTHPDTCRRLAGAASAAGCELVDAPVSGGGVVASERRLLVMVGGEEGTVERCRPVFATYGDPVIHLGPVGAGQAAKLLNNLLFTAHMALGTQVFELARSLSVEPGPLAEVLGHGSGASAAVGILARMGYTAAASADRAGPLLAKDLRLVVDLAGTAGAPVGQLVEVADAALALMGHRR